MLKLLEKKGSLRSLRRCSLTAGQRVSRRYRRANIRRIEYRRLKAIVPAIAERNKVTKVEVIEEAIKYIDELHKALYARVPLIHSNYPSLFNVSARCLFAQTLPFDPVQAPPATLTPASESHTTTGCQTSAAPASVSAAKHIQQTHQRFQAYLAQRAANVAQLQRQQRNFAAFPSNANIQSNGQTGFVAANSLCGALRTVQLNTKLQNF